MNEADVVRASDADGGVRILRIHDPSTRNALTADVVAGLRDAIGSIVDDDGVKVVVITGSEGMFCSGGNTRSMGGERPSPLARKRTLWSMNQRLMREIYSLDKPVIAAINGPAIGAGADLALHADLRLIADTTYMSWSYINLGVVPGAGGAWALPRLVGEATALELLWSGRRVSAVEAASLNIARAVPATDLEDATTKLATSFATKPLQALQLIKRMVRQAEWSSLDSALDAASSHFSVLQETDDHAEGVTAIRERRPPLFRDS